MKTKRRLLNMINTKQNVENRLSRDPATESTYQNLSEIPGPLNKDNKIYSRDIFALALAYGYQNNIKLPLEKRKQFIRSENFGKNLPALLKALAVSKSEKGIEILAENTPEIYNFAEQYANGGLDLLDSDYSGNTDEFIEKLRLRILKLNKDDKILKKLEELDL